MGKITDVVRNYVPASYRAMCASTNSYYSLSHLQDLAEFTQYRLFATVQTEANEATAYNLKQRELLGILTTLQFIPAAVDYWGDQISSQTASGINESESFFDRRTDLWKIFDKLQAEAAELSQELGLFSKLAQIPQVSYGDNGRGILVTEDPERFPRLHRRHIDSAIWSKWA